MDERADGTVAAHLGSRVRPVRLSRAEEIRQIEVRAMCKLRHPSGRSQG
ncbi:MAG: hypothetical protein ABIS47_05780 [Acidimicrobiales bacterium]